MNRTLGVLARAAAFLGAYLASTLLLQGHGPFRQAMLWLPTGIAVAGLARLGARYWPVVALGTVIHRVLIGYPPINIVPGAVGNAIEAITAAVVLRRLGFDTRLRRLKDVVALLVTAVVAPAVGAALGRFKFLFVPDHVGFLEGLSGWWRMNALGILVVAPLVLVWTSDRPPRPRARAVVEIAAIVVLVVAGIAFLLRLDPRNDGAGMVLSYLALPVALHAALRFGVRGAVTASAGLVLALHLGTLNGIGPFASSSIAQPVRELALQAVIAIVSATPLVLAAAVADREAALSDMASVRARFEDELRQTQKMEALGKLAGGVAHDFNNLLTVIMGFGETLREQLPRASSEREHAGQIVLAARRGAALTHQLLAYSRRQRLEPRVLDLTAVVASLTEMLRRLIGEDVQLVTRATDPDARVRADRGQLEQVLLNLAVNARDAMPHGGTLTIGVGPEPDAAGRAAAGDPAFVRLWVRDTGCGMDDEVRARAFDPFFTTKPPGSGTGLGLSTVFGIVHQSGGDVWIDSAPGAGTTMHVALPRAAHEPGVAISTAAAAPPRGDATVLVVEDEPPVRELIVRTLRDAGFRVIEAANGAEGLEVARAHAGPIDLVVSDLLMPRLGGREFVAALAAERPRLRALFISGYASDALDPERFRELGAGYLQKPFTPGELLESVAASVARPMVAR